MPIWEYVKPERRTVRDEQGITQQGRQDSNLQPPVLETGALPIELRPWVARTSVASRRAASCALDPVLGDHDCLRRARGLRVSIGREGDYRRSCGRRAGRLDGGSGAESMALTEAKKVFRTCGVFCGRVCKAWKRDAGVMAGLPEDARPGVARPADPDVRPARQVRGRPPRRHAARARRRAGPRLVWAARPDRGDRALRSRP